MAWHPHPNFAYAAQFALVPLVRSELSRAAVAMPVAFIEQAGQYLPAAVLSLVPGQNAFVAGDGRWIGGYVPALVRGLPFSLVRNANKPSERALCIDEQSGLADPGTEGAQPFFDAEGNLAPALRAIFDFLEKTERDRVPTEAATKALVDAGALRPWEITVKLPAGEHKVEGLHRVDEGALNALDDASFCRLRHTPALPLAYAQLLSMGSLAIFERLDRMQAQQRSQQATSSLLPGSMNNIFQLTGDDMLRFD